MLTAHFISWKIERKNVNIKPRKPLLKNMKKMFVIHISFFLLQYFLRPFYYVFCRVTVTYGLSEFRLIWRKRNITVSFNCWLHGPYTYARGLHFLSEIFPSYRIRILEIEWHGYIIKEFLLFGLCFYKKNSICLKKMNEPKYMEQKMLLYRMYRKKLLFEANKSQPWNCWAHGFIYIWIEKKWNMYCMKFYHDVLSI